jgi:uncharacterized protein (TIGR00730 family)
MMRRLCVFCGSSDGERPGYLELARQMGTALAERGIETVYGGGNVGLMGAVADAALAAGGRVIGVIPDGLLAKERGHRGISELEVVGSMHERKARMAKLSDGFIALPGGLGTLEELAEALTWSQLGLHRKPCGVVNLAGYFDPLIEFLDRAVEEGFMRAESRRMLLVAGDPAALLDAFEGYEAPVVRRWLEADEA